MSLNSLLFIEYFIVLFIVLLALQLLRRQEKISIYVERVQLLALLFFSYYYILMSSWKFCLCIFLYTCFLYVIGLIVKNNKPMLIIGITVSILMLGYFKYTNFFISEFAAIFGKDATMLNIILPIGISFYTFSGLSYIIDVYRYKYFPEKNFINFALYISFFAKITAGPIVRGEDFFPQLNNYRGITFNDFTVGIQIFVFGLFKKIVLADHLVIFVNDVFYAPSAFNTGTIILAAFSYTMQLYFDFSGYSDMAIGIAKICGFDFKPNFNLPFVAKGFSDFWKRWHISLSSWFQDYLYIPLGGSRKGTIRTYFNLIVIMVISGLWHGAGLTFIVWGLFHGIGSCVTRIVNKYEKARGKAFGKPLNLLRTIVTFTSFSLFFVVFRASSFENAMDVFKGIISVHTGISQPYTWSFFAMFCLILSIISALFKAKKSKEKYVNGFYPIMDLTKIIPLTIFFTFCGLTILLGYFGDTAFIYGKF